MGAQDTNCLFAQYRFEIPLAGARVYAGGTTGGQTTGRQTGHNFTGQYYTLHRHYDPFTMRWTSPDPAAQFFFNLFGYSGNNPARTVDPDGDFFMLIPAAMTVAIVAGIAYDCIANDGQTVKEVASRAWTGFRTIVQCPAQSFNHYARGDAESELTQSYRQMGQAYETRQQLLAAGGDSGGWSHVQAGLLAAGDVTGATGVSEFLTRTDSVTGAGLTAQEARVRGIMGAGALGMSAIGGAGMLNLSRGLATKAGSGAASLARSFASMERGLPVSSLRAGRSGMIRIAPGESLPGGFQPFKPRRTPRHHLFPQEHRTWFEARGVKIDRYTFEMIGWGEHSAIHSARFNARWNEFISGEAGRLTPYSAREILKRGAWLKREFQITGRHMPYRD
ncbi:MAG: DUF2380 domain-containing protein [Planctomycetes bacterium]|nr:DUF2380 domain-containing protein [Planctomycetota bacterium]